MKQSGLSSEQVETIRNILSLYSEVEKAVLFGSRAKGSQRAGSDVDLAIRGEHIRPMTLARLQGAMDESNLPFRVDLIWQNTELSADISEHISRNGKILYDKTLINSR